MERHKDPMKIVIPNDWNDAFAQSPLVAELRKRAEVEVCKLPGPAMDAALATADITVGIRERTRFEAPRLSAMPKLKLIAQIGGTDNPHIDVPLATRQGVLVCHTSGAGSGARTATGAGSPGGMVELTVGMMIAALRQFAQHDAVIRAGGWPDFTGRTIEGKTLGIVGLGRIGVGVAKAAQYFGMNVIAASKTLTPERAAAAGVGFTDLETLFAQSDVVSIHLKLIAATRGMVGRDLLGRMKPNALLINTSRGPLVDEDALIDVLERGAIGGAALDVFDEEPLAPNNRLRSCERAFLLGHCGWATEEAFDHMIPSIVSVINAFLDGKPVNMVNPDALVHA